MTIVLSQEIETKLREKADRDGVDVNAVAESLITAALDAEKRELEDAIAGIQRGIDAGAQGRVRPARDVLASLSAKLIDQSR